MMPTDFIKNRETSFITNFLALRPVLKDEYKCSQGLLREIHQEFVKIYNFPHSFIKFYLPTIYSFIHI